MNKKSKVLVTIGVALVVLSFAMLLFFNISSKNAQESADKIIAELETIIPSRVVGMRDDFSSPEMPVLEIYNKDIVGIVEIQRFSIKLPIENERHSNFTNSIPVRVSGSAYAKSLTISGSDKKGQFDCVNQLQLSDTINIVDMTGAEFVYEVSEIFRVPATDVKALTPKNDLTLIIKEEFSFDCVVISCKIR